MSATVFVAVLIAALMHASWNAVIRVTLDRFASVLLLALSQGFFALLMLPFVAFPAPEAWSFIAGAALLHTGYKLFLIRAYRHGELSQVYPIARGTAPLITVFAGALLFGERIGLQATLAVIAIGSGVMLLASGRGVARVPAKAVGYALGTAAFTSAYTIADAAGARVAGDPIGFAMWMFVIDGAAMGFYALVARGATILTDLRPALRPGIVAGALSLGSYGIVIWAFTQAPVALVAALRETSVLFAMLIAAIFLREQVPSGRWAAALIIAAGVVAMRA